MDEISSVNLSSTVAINMLQSSLEQSTQAADKLIEMTVENTIDINQLEYMGTVVDLYA